MAWLQESASHHIRDPCAEALSLIASKRMNELNLTVDDPCVLDGNKAPCRWRYLIYKSVGGSQLVST